MNGKKAKMFRRAAEAKTEGSPMVAYGKWRSPSYRLMRDNIGFVTGARKTHRGIPCAMLPGCTRAVYQQMKRAGK